MAYQRISMPEETRGEEATTSTPRFHGTAEVMGSRVADDPEAAGRREIVLTRAEIAELPVQTTQDLLMVLPGVGLARRARLSNGEKRLDRAGWG